MAPTGRLSSDRVGLFHTGDFLVDTLVGCATPWGTRETEPAGCPPYRKQTVWRHPAGARMSGTSPRPPSMLPMWRNTAAPVPHTSEPVRGLGPTASQHPRFTASSQCARGALSCLSPASRGDRGRDSGHDHRHRPRHQPEQHHRREVRQQAGDRGHQRLADPGGGCIPSGAGVVEVTVTTPSGTSGASSELYDTPLRADRAGADQPGRNESPRGGR